MADGAEHGSGQDHVVGRAPGEGVDNPERLGAVTSLSGCNSVQRYTIATSRS